MNLLVASEDRGLTTALSGRGFRVLQPGTSLDLLWALDCGDLLVLDSRDRRWPAGALADAVRVLCRDISVVTVDGPEDLAPVLLAARERSRDPGTS
jgi:hypothetical protein